MRLHAFLARAADLPRALRDGTEGFEGTLLSGADSANLSSLFELVTHGALPADQALAELDHPVAEAGANGPSIYAVPASATAALAAASAGELDRWGLDWAGPDSSPDDAASLTVRALAALSARATPEQALYIRLDARAGAKDLPSTGEGAKDLPPPSTIPKR